MRIQGMNPSFSTSFVAIQRVRLRLAREGEAASLSHLQQIEVIRRALQRAAWPVATQGRKLSLKVAFGPAISVGYESQSEYCDAELTSRLDLKASSENLAPHLPKGFSIVSIKSIPRFFPSLEQSLNVAVYEISSRLLVGVEDKWQAFDREPHFFVVKKKADRDVPIDAKLCVRAWKLEGERLELQMRFGPGRTLKPEKVIQAVCHLSDEQVLMGSPTAELRIKRAQLFFEKENGQLVEP